MSQTALLCDAAESVLVVIDIQERLAKAMPDKPLQHLVERTGLLLQAARLLDIPVLRTEHYPKGLGPTLPDIEQQLHKDHKIEKTCFSCCDASGFEQTLQKTARRQVVLTGTESHVCVLQTALGLQASGHQAFVVSDAVYSRHKANHKNALRRMAQSGVVITNSESVLFEWLRDSQHEQFKTILAMLR